MSSNPATNTSPWSWIAYALGGAAALVYYRAFLHDAPWMSPFGRLLVAGSATGAILRAGWLLSRRARSRFLPRPKEPDQEPKPAAGVLKISWVGILLTLFGVEMLLMARNVPDPLATGCLLILGAIGVLSGARLIGRTLFDEPQAGTVRHRFALPTQGIVYLLIMTVLFAGSLLTRENMLMLVFSMMAAPFLLNGAIIVSMLKRLTLTRSAPAAAVAGERFTVELTVENEKRLLAATLMTVTDRLTNDRETLHAAALIARIPPRQKRVARYQLRLTQRGRYRFGPLSVETRFPLGLVERGITIEMPGEVLVYPPIGRLTPAWKREHGTADEVVHRQDTRRGLFEDEFHRIREYRPGDNPRAIHWRTSARQGELMIREYHQSRNLDLLVLLDLYLPERVTPEDRDRLELAISFAATISREQVLRSRDSRLSVAAVGQQLTEWEGPCGPAGLDSLMSLLALVEGGPAPDLDRLLTWGRARRGPATKTLLVTSRPPTDGTGPLPESLRQTGDFGRELRLVSSEPGELQRWFHLES